MIEKLKADSYVLDGISQRCGLEYIKTTIRKTNGDGRQIVRIGNTRITVTSETFEFS